VEQSEQYKAREGAMKCRPRDIVAFPGYRVCVCVPDDKTQRSY